MNYKKLDFLLIFLIFTAAFIYNFIHAQKGFFAFDQSIVYDGAYRIIKGQILFKDFITPVGPVTFYIQALFFKIFGLNYCSYLMHSSLFHGIAVVASILILRMLTNIKIFSYLGGVFTLFWFYPLFGTPWYGNNAYFFSMIGLLFILYGLFRQPKHESFFLIIAGICCTLSFFSKQNIGLFFIPIYYIIILVFDVFNIKKTIKRSLVFSLSAFLSTAAIILLVVIFSDFNNFIKYFFVIPSEAGILRLNKNIFFASEKLILGSLPPLLKIFQAPFLFFYSMFIIIALSNFKKIYLPLKKEFIASALALWLILFQNASQLTTFNAPVNALGFNGIIFIPALYMIYSYLIQKKLSITSLNNTYTINKNKILTPVFYIFIIALLTINVTFAFRWTTSRKMHDAFLFSHSKFKEHVDIDALSCLKWGNPTFSNRRHEGNISANDMKELYAFLKTQQNFFIFPCYSIFYSLCGTNPPQPILWFHQGLTHSKENNAELDEWVVSSLIKNKISAVVIEDKWKKMLNDFPKVKNYIHTEFRKTRSISMFTIYEPRDFELMSENLGD